MMIRVRDLTLPFVLATCFTLGGCSDAASDAFAEKLARASACERDGQLHDATRIYAELLATDLAPNDRVDVRFRLAKCRLAGDDLNGTLDALDELVAEDVKSFQLDLGPLYLELGDKYFEKGDRKKAQLAWQLGRSVSPSRIVDFNKKIEQLLPPEPPPTPTESNPPTGG